MDRQRRRTPRGRLAGAAVALAAALVGAVLVGVVVAALAALAPAADAAPVDPCSVLSKATVTKMLRGAAPAGAPRSPRNGFCGWTTGEKPIPKAGASIVYLVYPTEAEAKKQFQIYAGFSGATKVSGVGDEAVMADHPGLSALTARKGALFVHLEEGGKGAAAKPLADIAKAVITKGKA